MKNNRLKKFFDLTGEDTKTVAAALDMNYATFYEIVKGKRHLRKVNALALEALYGVNHKWLLGDNTDMIMLEDSNLLKGNFRKLYDAFNSMTPNKKAKLLDFIETFAEKE